MPQATTKPIPVTYLPVTSPGDMAEALIAALSIGYRGKVEVYADPTGAAVWTMEINGPGNPQPVVANFGDVLIWDGIYLKVMPDSEFSKNYTK